MVHSHGNYDLIDCHLQVYFSYNGYCKSGMRHNYYTILGMCLAVCFFAITRHIRLFTATRFVTTPNPKRRTNKTRQGSAKSEAGATLLYHSGSTADHCYMYQIS